MENKCGCALISVKQIECEKNYQNPIKSIKLRNDIDTRQILTYLKGLETLSRRHKIAFSLMVSDKEIEINLQFSKPIIKF